MTRPLEPVDRQEFYALIARVRTLEDAMQKITQCKACLGVGAQLNDQLILDECPACHGTGENPALEQDQ